MFLTFTFATFHHAVSVCARVRVCATDLFEVCFVSIHCCSLNCTKLIMALPHAFVIFINMRIQARVCAVLHAAFGMLYAHKLETDTLIFGLVSCLQLLYAAICN